MGKKGSLQTTGFAENTPFCQLSACFGERAVKEVLFPMFSAYNPFILLHS
ncbi:hypothetical protein [Bacillus sp. PK3-136]